MGRVSNHRRLLKLQRQIFQSLETEVESLFGRPPETIRRYEREYLADFRAAGRARLTQVPKSELLQAIRRAEVIFVADFHTFPQAQRTMLRLLREAAGLRPGLALGLELISTDHQDSLDAFQAGRIGLVEFHRAVGYRKNWGFPWENYAPLFAWAREHSVRLLALNRPRNPERSRAPSARRAARLALALSEGTASSELHDRDRWGAAVIADHFIQSEAAGEEPRVFVLYGELHLGSRHLPARLRDASVRHYGRALDTVTVHQDRDSLFWKLAEKGKEIETEILRLSRDSFCVFSGTPWARLMSLIAWAEGDSEDPSGLEARLRANSNQIGSNNKRLGNQADYLSLMRSDASAIARFLSLPTPSFESLGAYTIDEADILESARVRHAFTPQERALIRFHVMHSIRLYLPRICVAYLANPSFNSLSEMAAVHILRTFSGDSRLFDGTDESFFRRVIEHAFGFFGSLVLNPRRKCDHIADHEHRAESLRKEAVSPAFPGELEARKIAVRVLRTRARELAKLHVMNRRSATRTSTRHLTSAMMAARYVGEILGKRLHRAALGESIALGRVIEICLEPLTDPNDSHRGRYFRLAQLLAPAALPRSKRSAL